MNRIYDFSWVVEDIYNSIIFKLYYKSIDKKEYYGTFEVDSILSSVGDEISVRFANIDDLTSLLNMGIIRFVDIDNIDNIVDIPLRKIYMLFENSNKLGDTEERYVKINDIESFSVYDGSILNDEYMISVYEVDNPSNYLYELINIAKNFGSMGMQEKFDAIGNVNLINYHRINDDSKKRL